MSCGKDGVGKPPDCHPAPRLPLPFVPTGRSPTTQQTPTTSYLLHRVRGVLHRELGVLHRELGVLHRVLGLVHRALGVLGVPPLSPLPSQGSIVLRPSAGPLFGWVRLQQHRRGSPPPPHPLAPAPPLPRTPWPHPPRWPPPARAMCRTPTTGWKTSRDAVACLPQFHSGIGVWVHNDPPLLYLWLFRPFSGHFGPRLAVLPFY